MPPGHPEGIVRPRLGNLSRIQPVSGGAKSEFRFAESSRRAYEDLDLPETVAETPVRVEFDGRGREWAPVAAINEAWIENVRRGLLHLPTPTDPYNCESAGSYISKYPA